MSRFTSAEVQAEAHRHGDHVAEMLYDFAAILNQPQPVVSQPELSDDSDPYDSRQLGADERYVGVVEGSQPDATCSLNEALNVIEEWAEQGNKLHGDDVLRFRAAADKIAPPEPVGVSDEDVMDAVRIALNDWTATYASEFCDEDAVKAAHKRISAQGTLGYICDTMGSLDTIRAELHRLTDRLAAADALLREIADCGWFEREAPATTELIRERLKDSQP